MTVIPNLLITLFETLTTHETVGSVIEVPLILFSHYDVLLLLHPIHDLILHLYHHPIGKDIHEILPRVKKLITRTVYGRWETSSRRVGNFKFCGSLWLICGLWLIVAHPCSKQFGLGKRGGWKHVAHFPKVMAHKADLCSKNIFWRGVLHQLDAVLRDNLSRFCGTTSCGVPASSCFGNLVSATRCSKNGIAASSCCRLLHHGVAGFCNTEYLIQKNSTNLKNQRHLKRQASINLLINKSFQ